MDGPHHIRVILLVVEFDNLIDILRLYHMVVVDESTQHLNVMQTPHIAVLSVKDVVVYHGTESLFILMSNSNLIVLVEHKAKIPIASRP